MYAWWRGGGPPPKYAWWRGGGPPPKYAWWGRVETPLLKVQSGSELVVTILLVHINKLLQVTYKTRMLPLYSLSEGLQCKPIERSSKATEALPSDSYESVKCEQGLYFDSSSNDEISLKCYAWKTEQGWSLAWLRNGYFYEPKCKRMPSCCISLCLFTYAPECHLTALPLSSQFSSNILNGNWRMRVVV